MKKKHQMGGLWWVAPEASNPKQPNWDPVPCEAAAATKIIADNVNMHHEVIYLACLIPITGYFGLRCAKSGTTFYISNLCMLMAFPVWAALSGDYWRVQWTSSSSSSSAWAWMDLPRHSTVENRANSERQTWETRGGENPSCDCRWR